MARKTRYSVTSGSTKHMRGYADGTERPVDESGLYAYYAGVGYAKKKNGVKNIGFSSMKEKASFENGMKSESKHFSTARYEPLTFIERLLGKRERVNRVKRAKTSYKRTQRKTKNM